MNSMVPSVASPMSLMDANPSIMHLDHQSSAPLVTSYAITTHAAAFNRSTDAPPPTKSVPPSALTANDTKPASPPCQPRNRVFQSSSPDEASYASVTPFQLVLCSLVPVTNTVAPSGLVVTAFGESRRPALLLNRADHSREPGIALEGVLAAGAAESRNRSAATTAILIGRASRDPSARFT